MEIIHNKIFRNIAKGEGNDFITVSWLSAKNKADVKVADFGSLKAAL